MRKITSFTQTAMGNGTMFCGCQDRFKHLVQPLRTKEDTLAILACPFIEIAKIRAVFDGFGHEAYRFIKDNPHDLNALIFLLEDPCILDTYLKNQ